MKLTTDPIIPSNYISWRQLVAAECLNAERTETAIKTTFARIQTKQVELGFKSFNKFCGYYNTYTNGLITDKSINYLLTIGAIEPIAHQIKVFASNRVSRGGSDRDGGNVYLVYDFGILKGHYEYFKKHGVPKRVANRGRTKENYDCEPSENKRTKVDMPKCTDWERLKAGVSYANSLSNDKTTVSKVLMAAAVEYMDARPQIFLPSKAEVATDKAIRVKSNENLNAQISPDIMRRFSASLARYNSANTRKLSHSQFVELAIKGMLERIDSVYSDPRLAKALEEK